MHKGNVITYDTKGCQLFPMHSLKTDPQHVPCKIQAKWLYGFVQNICYFKIIVNSTKMP